MSTGEAARRCGLSRHTLLRAARRGDLLPASRTPGGDLRFRAADVEAFAEQLAHPLPPAGGIGQDGVRRPQGGFSPRWDRLVAASPDLMCVADTRGFFKWVNPAFTTLLGWSSEELLAFPYAHFLHPDDHDRTYTVEALLRQGKPVAAFENRYRCTDGSWRWIAWTTTPWSSDGLLYAVGRDVTERRHLEDALRANEERFRSAFEDAGIGMAIVDVDGGLVHVNSAFCTLVGYTKEELLQSAWPTLTDPDDLAASHALAQRLIASQTRFEILEKRFIHKDGHAVWVVLSSTLVRDADGQPRYFISQIQDISSRKAAERHMRILADLLDQAHDAVIVRDPVTSTITYWNRGAERLYGWTPDAALGRVIQAVFPEPKEAVDATLERDGEWLGQVVYTGRDGRQRYVESRQVLRRDAQGRPEAVLEINRDITDQKRAEAELRASEHSLRALIAKAPVGAAIIDERGILEVVNSAYAAIFGYTPAEMIGQSCGMVVAAEQRPAFVAKALELLAGGQEAAGETEAIHRDGRPLVLWFTGSTVSWTDGRPRRASFVIDITQRKHAEDRLAYASQHDALTSLPNRVLFADRLEQALHTVDRERASLALLLIDLDGFKVVNDTLGHAAGDRLLREVGRRLQAAVRVSDTVARLGGDEFAVLVPGTEEGGAIRVASKICTLLTGQVSLSEGKAQVGCSVGIALYPEHGETAASLMHCADRAMYVAKAGGGGYLVYDEDLEESGTAGSGLGSELRRAIPSGELRLYYQPVVRYTTEQVEWAEVHVCWQHTRLGLLTAQDFLPLAVRTGAITALSVWVLEEAIQQCAAWHAHGLQLGVAVSISPLTVQEAQLPDLIAALLRHYAVPASRLTLQVSESTLLYQPEQAVVTLERLATLGVHLALDHFGSGYASLSQLRRLPVHIVKLDRLFLEDLDDKKNVGLLASLLNLGGTTGVRVVADGVESATTWELLGTLQCELVQGSYVAKPLLAAHLEQWVLAGPWRSATPGHRHQTVFRVARDFGVPPYHSYS